MMYHFLPRVVCRASRLEMTTDRDWRLFRSQREPGGHLINGRDLIVRQEQFVSII